MAEGQAFVAPAVGLLGERLLRWDWDFLEEHLPSEERYGVMLGEGDLQKVVMSHTARNGERQLDVKSASSTATAAKVAEEPHTASDQTRMTFREYRTDVARYRRDGGRLPYFGLHLLWRHKAGDNGFLGKIDDEMAEDLWSVRFDVIKDLQDANLLPLVQRFYLFAGVGGTLYHCHYDLQPNLHVQLTGRKRFILFPPESSPSLYPYPVHHDLDRRSMVDLDDPDSALMPRWREARGFQVELEPGEALYIPPFWWHHVQSITPETTSMAMWFFEHFPLSAKVLYGVGPRSEGLLLLRDVEELVGRQFADVPGEDDCSKPRPTKAAQVASFMHWLQPRIGLPTPTVDEADRQRLLELKRPPEAVEELLHSLVAEKRTGIVPGPSSGRESTVDVEGTLRTILASRF